MSENDHLLQSIRHTDGLALGRPSMNSPRVLMPYNLHALALLALNRQDFFMPDRIFLNSLAFSHEH